MKKYIPFVKVMFYVLLFFFVAIGSTFGWANLLYLAVAPFSLINLVVAIATAPVFVIGSKAVLGFLLTRILDEKKWEARLL